MDKVTCTLLRKYSLSVLCCKSITSHDSPKYYKWCSSLFSWYYSIWVAWLAFGISYWLKSKYVQQIWKWAAGLHCVIEITTQNSPIINEWQSQPAKVLALPWEGAHQEDSDNTPCRLWGTYLYIMLKLLLMEYDIHHRFESCEESSKGMCSTSLNAK